MKVIKCDRCGAEVDGMSSYRDFDLCPKCNEVVFEGWVNPVTQRGGAAPAFRLTGPGLRSANAEADAVTS